MTTNTIKIALTTDDGISFSSKHFGSAERYIVFSYNGKNLIKESDIINNTEEEKEDGDPEKAKSVGQILKQQNVTIVTARRFGPNIIRIQKQFLPIITDSFLIDDGIQAIKNQWQYIIEAHNNNKQQHLLLKTKDGKKISAKIKQDDCVGCEACVTACPTDAITMDNKTATINKNICVACGTCIDSCMVQAIKLTKKEYNNE